MTSIYLYNLEKMLQPSSQQIYLVACTHVMYFFIFLFKHSKKVEKNKVKKKKHLRDPENMIWLNTIVSIQLKSVHLCLLQ